MTHRLLIAEDDPHTRAALEELASADGYEVVAVGDGLSAKRAIDARPFDLICLDVMMPMTNGFDLCKHIRSTDHHTPIIFITAKGEEIDKVVGFELGADDYISKPFGSHEVLARIKAVLRRCSRTTVATDKTAPVEPTAHDAFQMGDLQVVPSKLRAYRNEDPIPLSAREMQILILLHQANGDVVSRRTLYQCCWDAVAVPNSRTVDQTVSQLRKRIEQDVKQPKIIRTVYGVGYRFENEEQA